MTRQLLALTIENGKYNLKSSHHRKGISYNVITNSCTLQEIKSYSKMDWFICPGAQKAATTTLHKILSQHKSIYLPKCKETHFFDNDDEYRRGLQYYKGKYFNSADDEKIAGEVTPSYMYLEHVPSRLSEAFGPRLKMVFLLRHPVERAYSQYWMHYSRGIESASFGEAVRREVRRRRRLEKKEIKKLNREKKIRNYVERGFYAKKIKVFREYFDEENMKFVIFEEFIDNIEEETKKIFSFLDIKEDSRIKYNISSNESKVPTSRWIEKLKRRKKVIKAAKLLVPNEWVRSKIKETVDRMNLSRGKCKKINKKSYNYLLNIYKNDIEQLESMIGRKIGRWNI
jgi:hypothetical protein